VARNKERCTKGIVGSVNLLTSHLFLFLKRMLAFGPRLLSRSLNFRSRPLCSFQPKNFLKSVNPNYFKLSVKKLIACGPAYSQEFTDILTAYKTAKTQKVFLDDTKTDFLNFINIGIDPTTQQPVPFSHIIIERSFYEELFRLTRKQSKVILTGNAGTGKSCFLFYYLYRLCQACETGTDLPPGLQGSVKPPDVVIFERGTANIVLYFLKEGKALTVGHRLIDDVLDIFDKPSNLHLIEPAGRIMIAPDTETSIQAFKANSMDDKYGIKEFHKRFPLFYMPVYELQEFLLIGKYFRDQPQDPNHDFSKLYSEQKIKERFELYNGIFRHVFPADKKAETVHLKNRINALNVADPKLFHVRELDQIVNVSNKLMVIRVPREGLMAYEEIEYLDFAGKDIPQKLAEKETKNSMNEILIELIRADEIKVQTFSPHSYELYFGYALTNGIHWPARDLTNQPKTLFSKPFLPTRLVLGKVPKYALMKPGVAYRSLSSNFPLTDLIFMDTDGDVYLFNMKTGISSSTVSVGQGPLLRLIDAKHLDVSLDIVKQKFHFVVVPLHSMAPTISVNIIDPNKSKKGKETEGEAPKEKDTGINWFKSLLVLHPPKDYAFGPLEAVAQQRKTRRKRSVHPINR
jgi:hypothetical protein